MKLIMKESDVAPAIDQSREPTKPKATKLPTSKAPHRHTAHRGYPERDMRAAGTHYSCYIA